VKIVDDVQLAEPLRHALQTAYERLTAEFGVDRLVLFGSVVRGASDEESDADLLVVLTERPTHQTRDRITSVILDINLKYGTNLSELIVDRQTWECGLPSALPIHAEIEEEGIRL
jgi:predicted nucleotidyltransferase